RHPLDLGPFLAQDVDALRDRLVLVALGQVYAPAVLEPLVEEADRFVDRAGTAVLARPRTRHDPGLIPERLAVPRAHAEPPQTSDVCPVGVGHPARQGRARGRLVERRVLIREAGHRAADAGSAG